jgi:hypothetical protein
VQVRLRKRLKLGISVDFRVEDNLVISKVCAPMMSINQKAPFMEEESFEASTATPFPHRRFSPIEKEGLQNAVRAIPSRILTANAKHVLGALIRFYNHNFGYAFPTYDDLMRACGCTRDSVARSLQALRAGEWVRSRRLTNKSDGYDNNVYYINFDRILALSFAAKGARGAGTPSEPSPKSVLYEVRFSDSGSLKNGPYKDYNTGYQTQHTDDSDPANAGRDMSAQAHNRDAADRLISGASNHRGRNDPPTPVNDNAGWPSNAFEQFKNAYPPYEDYNWHEEPDQFVNLEEDWRVARIWLNRIRKSGRVSFARLLEGVRNYANRKEDTPWCKPASYLAAERWDDEYETGLKPSDRCA